MNSHDATSSRTVLLADDSPTIRRIVDLALADSGIAVEAVADGRAALQSLERRRFTVVLLDVAMPGPSGYELCRRVKRGSRPTPTLLLVGTFEPFDEARAGRCGADGWLVKPFEPEALHARIEELAGLESPACADPDEPAEPEEIVVRAEPAVAARPDAAQPAGPGGAAPGAAGAPSDALVAAVTRAVVERMSDRVIRDVAREVVPKLAVTIIRERLDELERE